MWFPHLIQCSWWLITQNKKTMVDYDVKFQGWLEEATLFPAEPNDYGFNFDEILSGKANNEESFDTSLPDFDWLDAPADLNILDDPKGFNFQPFENTDPISLDDATSLLLGLMDSNLDTSYLSSNVSKDELINILNAGAEIEEQVSSPEVFDLPLPSPFYESISEASSPASATYCTEGYNPDLCLSPSGNSSIEDGGYESTSEVASPSTIDSGVVSVTVCDMETTSDPLSTVSIDEVTHSVRKRRYVSDGHDIPKVKVSLRNVFHPYAKTATKRSGGKNERKKVQNKEAAARYRIKKRVEENVLSGEVACLEKEQEGLRKQHDGLLSEIKYLKNLMREVLQKKGVL